MVPAILCQTFSGDIHTCCYDVQGSAEGALSEQDVVVDTLHGSIGDPGASVRQFADSVDVSGDGNAGDTLFLTGEWRQRGGASSPSPQGDGTYR